MASKPVGVKGASINELKTSAATAKTGDVEKPMTNGYHDDHGSNSLAESQSRPSVSTPTVSSFSSSSSSSSSSSGESSKSNTLVDDDELKRLLNTQLEFYFSRENLLHDKYLVSQMDSDNYVPLVILESFNMIRKLFSNSVRFAPTASNGKQLCFLINKN